MNSTFLHKVLSLVVLLFAVFSTMALAQDFQPPPGQKIDDKTKQLIAAKSKALRGAITSLGKQGLGDPWLSDIEVYSKAAAWIVAHDEFFTKAFGDWTLEALDRGLLRATLASSGDFPWVNVRGYPVIRSYRSKIDGSVQPFAVTFPKEYGINPKKKWRLDVVLHGRDKTLNEVKFLHRFNGDKEEAPDSFVKIDIYGRGNNAYRWAGEVDVLEAIGAFLAVENKLGRGHLLDPQRVVLRGFSMGGAGTWHLGLHMPDRWCVIGPGAGFTVTHGYIKGLPNPLPNYQEKCLRIYDAADYAENVFNVPVVSYGGEKDAQLQASINIQNKLKPFPFADRMQLLIAPGLAHSFPPEWQKKTEAAYAPIVAKGRSEFPEKVRFVTYTMKYHSCAWVEILGLENHYEKALVEAEVQKENFLVKTVNIQSLHLNLPSLEKQTIKLQIDGQKLDVRPWVSQNLTNHIYLKKGPGGWKTVLPQRLLTERNLHPRKSTGLQGPIDDAFSDGFLCVRGTGKPWHATTQKYNEGDLERFKNEWSKFWRGELPVKDDAEITDQDIASKHLILFGDPSSNSLIAQVLDGLPLQWDKDKISLGGGQTFSSTNHVPVLIYPSPLNAQRYVVLNSGHTFHKADYVGTNALLYPRLGDFAVLRLAPKDEDPLGMEIVTAGLFDDSWRIGTKSQE